MFAAYQPLPSSENTYPLPCSAPPRQSLSRLLPWPPSEPFPGPPYPLRPTKSLFTPNHIIRYALAVTGGLIIFHYVIIGAFPNSTYTIKFRKKFTGYKVWEADEAYKAATASAEMYCPISTLQLASPVRSFEIAFPSGRCWPFGSWPRKR